MRLEDQFEVVREVGRGGFGRVLLVREKKSGKYWAAKVLISPDDVEARRRFWREVKQLHHYKSLRLRFVMPLIRPFLDAAEPFFLMPYAEGGSLLQFAGRLSERQLITVMRQLMETLTAIHAAGGFHRDVKPENMLLMSGTAALADFGLGNSPSCTMNFTMSTGGTPGYAAPELLRFESFSAECDVFSAGATWFHLATGRHPKDLALPLDLRSLKSEMPEWMVSWVRAMTSPLAYQRPQAHQVLEALSKALQGRDEALPSSPPTDWTGLLKAAAVLGLGAFAISLFSPKSS